MTARTFVRHWMQKGRLNATDTAKLLGMKLPAFSQIMNDHRRQPSLRTAAHFEDVIGVPLRMWLKPEPPTLEPAELNDPAWEGAAHE